jgi:hypothetical protein
MSETNGNRPARTATLRAEVLKSEIGNAYSRNPRTRLENRMDRPVNGKRKSIFKEEQRIEAAIERYSWCWPICMRSPVLTLGALGISAEEARQQGLRLGDDEGEDTFILDEHGGAKPLTMTHMAKILGMKVQNVSQLYSLMVAKRTLQVDGKWVRLVPNPPQLTPYERETVIQMDNFYFQLSSLGLPEDGPRLPPEDLEFLASIPEKVIRLDYSYLLGAIQKDYEKARRDLQTERDRRRKVIHEKARNLIVNQPFQTAQSRSSSSSGGATETTTNPEPDPAAEFHAALCVAFRDANKQVPTRKQSDPCFTRLAGRAAAFLAWIQEHNKLAPIQHPGVLPLLVPELCTSLTSDQPRLGLK